MLLFAMKTADLEYRSTLFEHKPFRDSSDIHLQLNMLDKEIRLLEKLDSTAAILTDDKLSEKSIDYSSFVSSTYSNGSVLKSYIRSLTEFGLREHKKKTAARAQYTRALEYIVDGSDSIPLSGNLVNTYKPLVTTPEKFTMGLSLKDTTQLQGYFYTITSSRTPEVKAFFPLDKSAFKSGTISAARGLAYSDAGGQIYYMLVYSEQTLKEKIHATVAKIYRSDGLSWRVDCPLTFTPTELSVSADTGELLIRNGTEQVVVDKNGKVR